jgi:hypothetical protein
MRLSASTSEREVEGKGSKAEGKKKIPKGLQLQPLRLIPILHPNISHLRSGYLISLLFPARSGRCAS